MLRSDVDAKWMSLALEEAHAAYAAGECPVGAVVVQGDELIAKAHNMDLALHDASAHAEILAIRAAGKRLGHHKLRGCTVYTTLEPCPMCEAAMLQAEIARVVSGGRTFGWVKRVRFNPEALTKDGPIMDQECRGIFRQWLVETGRTHILEGE